jgi:hypothetical protein
MTSNFFMAGRAAILALFPVAGVLGYSDTVPIVAWSSIRFVSAVSIIRSRLTLAQLVRVKQSISRSTV